MARPQKKEDQIIEEKNLDTSNLPKKDLFRIDEVAAYFDVSEWTIRLWISHGKLKTEQYTKGTLRIPRASIVNFRMKNFPNPNIN